MTIPLRKKIKIKQKLMQSARVIIATEIGGVVGAVGDWESLP
jgi:hypothetical protein